MPSERIVTTDVSSKDKTWEEQANYVDGVGEFTDRVFVLILCCGANVVLAFGHY